MLNNTTLEIFFLVSDQLKRLWYPLVETDMHLYFKTKIYVFIHVYEN